MSRSYKKHPYAGETQNKSNKVLANRKFRRDSKNLDSKSTKYKRNYPSWDIRDYGEVAPSFQAFCQDLMERPHFCKREFAKLSPSLSFEEKAMILYKEYFIRK